MNVDNKNKINSLAKWGNRLFENLTGTIISLSRISVLSSFKVAFKSRYYESLRENDTCVLLANGPSLKESLHKGIAECVFSDVFCVNGFCLSDFFWEIKPSMYFLIDGAFFNPVHDRAKKLVADVVAALSKVDWKLTLAVPSYYSPDNLLSQISNENIIVQRFNTTKVSGFDWFKNLCYRSCLGMPVCANVTIFSIMAAVWMGYKKVWLYGLELGMFTKLSVDQDNVLCLEDSHVYEIGSRLIKKEGRSLADELQGYVDCFNSHTENNRYAKIKGCQIINATKGSFIDAYTRQ